MKKEKYLSILHNDFSPYKHVTDFLDNTHCLIFDTELDTLYKNVKNMYDILKLAKERFQRKDTLNISSSIAKYMENVNDIDKYPYVLYQFLHRNVKICITQYKKRYYVYAVGWDFLSHFRKYVYQNNKSLFGGYMSLSDTIELYDDMVRSYCSRSAYKESQRELR